MRYLAPTGTTMTPKDISGELQNILDVIVVTFFIALIKHNHQKQLEEKALYFIL